MTARDSTSLTENVANVNLRGLGASRTLVLINGRRHVPVPARLIGGRFVDVNTIPAIAVGRLEVMKEGASATYGSDAVGGVANFVTRSDFRGFEFNVAHDYFDSGGDTTVAGIWGGRIGNSSAVFSAERVGRQELQMEDRPWTLDRLSTHVGGNRAGWSSLGNPGTYAVGAPTPWTADVFDPRCTDFGGQDEGWTCRFRYAPYDNLIDEQEQTRAFAEINGPLNDRTNYHIEGLWADAVIPNWYTTPSYPPFPLTSTTIMEVAADHPGRQQFCSSYAGDGKADPMGACMGDAPWYLNGRPFGNSGPGRRLRRESRTARIAASVDGDFLMGGRNANWDVGMSYSRAQGNLNLPAVYTDRIYRSFRGFGGPDCGVGVMADRSSPAGMTLGPLGGAVAGQGPCMYYNPFSNAIQRSDQPGAPFRNTDNPDYVPALANPEALRLWLNEEVDLVSTTDLFVADATLSGNLVENVADFAVGYQYRGTHADGDPNDPGDVTRNPCPVAGDMDCPAGVRFGPYLFTNVHRPYAADQQVQRLFGELALGLGPRVDTQLAANYEFYNVAGSRVNSFDPKVGWRIRGQRIWSSRAGETMKTTLLMASLLALPLAAAAQDGGISGTVTDDTGGVLPGVTVEASGAALAGPLVAVTDGDGQYAFPALPPGGYIVTFTLAGFERLELDVELAAGLTATVDADLQLGGLFEEVTVAVTGTAIEAPAINMPHAVTVVSRETLEQQGATQLVDLFRNLNVSHGVVGERNSWYNSNQPSTLTENVANVNLRGLGASRTLVLINGRRHVPVPARLIGGRFVDASLRILVSDSSIMPYCCSACPYSLVNYHILSRNPEDHPSRLRT